jgi:glutathione S-transferase
MQGLQRQGTLANTPILGYWKIRGLGAGIRYQMEHCGVNYDVEEYQQGGPPNYSRSHWTDEKFKLGLDFPNLPYLIDGQYKLTESIAIHKYIADKWDQDLLGKDIATRAKVNMIIYPIAELK